MRKIIAALSIAMLCITANANSKSPAYLKAQREERCRDVMEVAEAVMYSRQNNMPMLKSLEVLDKFFTLPEDQAVYDGAQQMVVHAYKTAYYHTDDLKLLAINEFAALHYMACLDFNKK